MTAPVRFGLWYDFRNSAPSRYSFEDLYAEYLRQIAWAETLGFESVWLTEHHFVEDGYTPSPAVIAAAIGQRTRGRFDLGVGLGYRELEFNYFRRDLIATTSGWSISTSASRSSL